MMNERSLLVEPRKRLPFLHTGAGMVAVLLWSTSVAFGRSLTEQLGSLTTIALINMVGGVVGTGLHVIQQQHRLYKPAFSPPYVLVCGMLYVLYQACLYIALGLASTRSQVLEVGLVNYLWPMLTLLFSVVLLKLRFHWMLVPGALTATAGVFLATMQNQAFSWMSFLNNPRQHTVPYVLGLTAAVSWALYSTLNRKWARSLPGNSVPQYMLASALILGLARLLFMHETTIWTRKACFEFVFLAAASSLGYLLWEHAVQKGDIVLVAAFSYFTPLFSVLIGTIYLGIQIGFWLWVGCGMVVIGALVCKFTVFARVPGETSIRTETGIHRIV